MARETGAKRGEAGVAYVELMRVVALGKPEDRAGLFCDYPADTGAPRTQGCRGAAEGRVEAPWGGK